MDETSFKLLDTPSRIAGLRTELAARQDSQKEHPVPGIRRSRTGAALLYSPIECCKLQNIDPQEWLLGVMKRIEYYPKASLVDLLPPKLPACPPILCPEAPIPKIKSTDKVPAVAKLPHYTAPA
jgi:hypothetical protein